MTSCDGGGSAISCWDGNRGNVMRAGSHARPLDSAGVLEVALSG